MTDTSFRLPRFSELDLPKGIDATEVDETSRYTVQALEDHKREGADLAVKARWAALVVIAILLPFLNPSLSVLYYEVALGLMAFNGWLMRRAARVGVSRVELALIFFDLLLITCVLVIPNPFATDAFPTAVVFEFGNFIYFFVILAGATLAYSWRTIMAIGNWTAAMWLIAAGLVWWLGTTDVALGDQVRAAFGNEAQLFGLFDPNAVKFDLRTQEIVVFVICAYTLALTVRRFNRLLLGHAVLERERSNLSRYFSPNVVAELSKGDEPLRETRTHDAAVLFVDLVGFTQTAASQPPEDVIATLRGFHGCMEEEVFRHGGTLDKYLGDGLMATFGTPFAGKNDASNALVAVFAMIAALERFNSDRKIGGLPELRASFGLHFGPVVLGNIGRNRLEFAVIGNTVNVASRLEALTRSLGAVLVVSDAIVQRVKAEGQVAVSLIQELQERPPQDVRGIEKPVPIWIMPR